MAPQTLTLYKSSLLSSPPMTSSSAPMAGIGTSCWPSASDSSRSCPPMTTSSVSTTNISDSFIGAVAAAVEEPCNTSSSSSLKFKTGSGGPKAEVIPSSSFEADEGLCFGVLRFRFPLPATAEDEGVEVLEAEESPDPIRFRFAEFDVGGLEDFLAA